MLPDLLAELDAMTPVSPPLWPPLSHRILLPTARTRMLDRTLATNPPLPAPALMRCCGACRMYG